MVSNNSLCWSEACLRRNFILLASVSSPQKGKVWENQVSWWSKCFHWKCFRRFFVATEVCTSAALYCHNVTCYNTFYSFVNKFSLQCFLQHIEIERQNTGFVGFKVLLYYKIWCILIQFYNFRVMYVCLYVCAYANVQHIAAVWFIPLS